MTKRYVTVKLDDPRREMYTYFVTGSGSFPVDMLRYDSCYPCSAHDAALLAETFTGDGRTVSIQMMSYRKPTVGRWMSFLWSVGAERLV